MRFMPSLSRLNAPNVDPLVLPQLAAGFSGDLSPGCDLDGLEFSGLELPDELSGASLLECEITDCRVTRLQLRGGRMLHTRITGLSAPALLAYGSSWRDVEINASRIGAFDATDAEVRRVVFQESKLGWLNLRSSTVRDVVFRNCTFDEVDFGGAKTERVRFENCRAQKLTLTNAQSKHLDLRGLDFAAFEGFEGLRGTVLNHEQLMYMTKGFAAHLGVTVED